MTGPSSSSRAASRAHRIVVLVLLVATGAALIAIVSDLLLALFLAAVFSGLLQPTYTRTLRALGGRRNLTAAIVLVTAVIAVGGPLTALIVVVVAEAIEVSESIGPYLSRAVSDGVDLDRLLPAWAQQLEPYRSRILTGLADWASTAASALVQSVPEATQGTAAFVLKLGVMLYAMFFFLRDGPEWLDQAVAHLPLDPAARESLLQRGLSVTRATLQSILVVGAAQGLLVGLAFWAADIPGAAFWGALVVPASAIPGLGAPLVWVPGVIYLLVQGDVGWAIAVSLWGAAIVGVIDNLLRARLVGGTTRMSDLLVLVATLGGIGALGPVGIIVGPVLAGLLLTMLELYRELFAYTLQ